MNEMNLFLSGAVMMACAGTAVFFFKYWKANADNLFLLFGLAFALLSAERWMLVLVPSTNEFRFYVYTFRLAAFVLIALAIVGKNRRS